MSEPFEQPSLARECVKDATWRDVLWVTLLPLSLVALFNFGLALTLQAFPNNRSDWLVRAKWQILADQQEAVDTLILGDSTCNQGIEPSTLSRVLGGRALNLCTTGDKLAVMDAWLFHAYQKRFGPPKRVIVMHAYDVWARNESILRRVAWTFGPYRTMFADAGPRIDWTIGEGILLRIGLWVPLYNQPQASLEALSAPREAVLRKPFQVTAEGFMAYKRANPKRVAREAKSYLHAARKKRAPLSAINRDALAEIVDNLLRDDTQLYVVHAPLFEGLWAHKDVRRYHAEVSQELERTIGSAPNARLISRDPRLFPETQMQNPDHVVGEAAIRLTEQVAADLSRLEGQ